MKITTLRPGLLVSLKTSIEGNAKYSRFQIEADHITEEGTRKARWETERVILDPAERKRASETRSKCRGLISRMCSHSAFGLLCPEANRGELDIAILEAQAAARAFNETAALTRVHVYVIAGRIAADDVQAIRAINSEVRGLLAEMEEAIGRLDVKAVRDAANRAKSIGQMLSADSAERLQGAVKAAREVARKIVKAGEEAGVAIDGQLVKQITDTRTAFLDLDGEIDEIDLPAAEARAVDLEPELPLKGDEPGDIELPPVVVVVSDFESPVVTERAVAASRDIEIPTN